MEEKIFVNKDAGVVLFTQSESEKRDALMRLSKNNISKVLMDSFLVAATNRTVHFFLNE